MGAEAVSVAAMSVSASRRASVKPSAAVAVVRVEGRVEAERVGIEK
jgi:hypothetical protein